MARYYCAAIAVLIGVATTLDVAAAPPSDDPGAFEVPPGLDLSRQHSSEEHRFIVAIHPTNRRPALNRIHTWTVSVKTPEGNPVEGAKIDFSGGMPAHNHGFPTEPRVTRSIGPGIYLIEGVKFSMAGWWEFVFEIHAGEIADRARFNLVIRE
jgi:hypothetical protein